VKIRRLGLNRYQYRLARRTIEHQGRRNTLLNQDDGFNTVLFLLIALPAVGDDFVIRRPRTPPKLALPIQVNLETHRNPLATIR
jgi:hypothetical protein